MKMHASKIAIVAVAAFAAGCGGSGSNLAPTASVNAPAQQSPQSVTFTINIPGRSTSGVVRRAAYIGAGTQSASITVTPGSGVQGSSTPTTTVNCTTVCQATITAYPGSNTFTAKLYDGVAGGGNLLSSGSTVQTIVAGSNTVHITFNGVPFAVAVVANPTSLSSGTAGTTTLSVSALDADFNTIVAPGVYTQNITLASVSPHITLSSTTISGPGQTVTANYDGTVVPCTTPEGITGTIGTVTGPAGAVIISNGPPCGLNASPLSLSVTAAAGSNHAGTVLVTEPGFAGTFTISTDTCTGPGYATISPSSGAGPSATFTITGVSSSGGLPCVYQFSDGTNTVTETVTVN